MFHRLLIGKCSKQGSSSTLHSFYYCFSSQPSRRAEMEQWFIVAKSNISPLNAKLKSDFLCVSDMPSHATQLLHRNSCVINVLLHVFLLIKQTLVLIVKSFLGKPTANCMMYVCLVRPLQKRESENLYVSKVPPVGKYLR